MAATVPSLDHLDSIFELNRSFLGYLQQRVRDGADGCGLPVAATPVLQRAAPAALDRAAEFPHALFRVRLDEPRDGAGRPGRHEGARTALYLSALLCARTVSRRSGYQARLLLGLDAHAIAQLNALTLDDVHRLASCDGVLECAFRSRERLWLSLLTETRSDARQRLAMAALQPGAEREWPQRRGALPAP